MRSDSNKYSIKKIIDKFEDKPKGALMTIKVDHFSMNFKPYLLQNKMSQFREDPDKMIGKPFTDFELALLLDDIVNKYDYSVEDFLAIKWAVDSQFETTRKFFKF